MRRGIKTTMSDTGAGSNTRPAPAAGFLRSGIALLQIPAERM
jgi:hypothetical protein